SVLLLLSVPAFAQKPLRGVVLDANGGTPLPGASVFLSNTSIGTVANSRGEFELSFPAGKYDLVVSAVDYETYSHSFTVAELPERLTVRLKPKAKELAGIVVQPYEKDGWKKWGQFFLENFMGTSDEARRCVIRNKETLRFRLDRVTNQLTAVAREPLVIENKALGYRITYQLEDFTYNYGSRVVSFYGFPFYEELAGGAGRERKWAAARRAAYYGSMMHFMRALYRNRLAEEGFIIYALRKIPDITRIAKTERLEQGRLIVLNNGTMLRSDEPDDTLRAYQSQLGREPVLTLVDGRRLAGDNLAYAADSATAVLDFTNYISVSYDRAKTPDAYQRTVRNSNYAMQSELCLLSGHPVVVESTGYYYNPMDLFSNGWWAWNEKMARMLPFDYKPE
ncbi:MAG: carboxypeptidase-like regulatory domain-containing protein, partial [Chitinophagaceae bacterium]